MVKNLPKSGVEVTKLNYFVILASKISVMLNYNVIANNPSNSWVVIVPDAGHVCNVDNKSFFNRASIEFFKQFGRL